MNYKLIQTEQLHEWTIDNTDIEEDLEASGSGDIPSFVVTNDTTSALVATIEVTPTYENNGFTLGDPETLR